MHGWTYRRYGGPEVLEWTSLPETPPGEGEIAVRVGEGGDGGVEAGVVVGVELEQGLARLHPVAGLGQADDAGRGAHRVLLASAAGAEPPGGDAAP